MLVIGGLCGAAAVVSWLFVSDNRVVVPLLTAIAPTHACALPVHDGL
jgi:hypothetical protein